MIKENFILEKTEAKLIQPLTLAMIGDAVQTLFIRTHIALEFGVKVNKINKLVSSVVSAGSQFLTFKKIEASLNGVLGKHGQDVETQGVDPKWS